MFLSFLAWFACGRKMDGKSGQSKFTSFFWEKPELMELGCVFLSINVGDSLDWSVLNFVSKCIRDVWDLKTRSARKPGRAEQLDGKTRFLSGPNGLVVVGLFVVKLYPDQSG